MRPLTVITGIVLGSSLSIAFSLAAVLIIFAILGGEYPRLNHEMTSLLTSLAIFTAMTAISAASFYALVKDHAARWLAQGVMWACLSVIGFFYWP